MNNAQAIGNHILNQEQKAFYKDLQVYNPKLIAITGDKRKGKKELTNKKKYKNF